MIKRMLTEQADHFMRHIERHAAALREGRFTKDVSYIDKLRSAQYTFLELAHDMVHVMRFKEFKGYENADFDFNVTLPENWKEHVFGSFDYNSFRVGIRIHEALDLGMVSERNMKLSLEDAERQMTNFGRVIQDAEVMIAMLEEHFAVND